MDRARASRTRRAAAVAAISIGLMAVGASPVTASPPAPAVSVSPAPEEGAGEVYGANAEGDVFYNSAAVVGSGGYRLGGGRVRHADGTVTTLAERLEGRGAVGPDGRLWLADQGALWTIAPDGTRAEQPVAGAGSPPSQITDVAVGPDARIWFLDRGRSSVGSVATDGTGASSWPVAGTGPVARLAPGADGRMWITRDGGVLQAVTLVGAVATYPTLGPGVRGLRATAGALYATVKGNLVRIAADGSRSVAWSGPDVGLTDVGASEGWAWFASDVDVLAVSPSGRIAPFGMPQSYVLPDSGPGLSLAPAAAGGFVGGVSGRLVRIPTAAVGERFSVSATVVASRGAHVLRVTATGRTPGGAALSGPLDVVIWGGLLLGDSIGVLQEFRQTSVGRLELVNGRGTLDVPITSALVRRARPSALLHASCCQITVRRPGTSAGPGLSSWLTGISGGPRASYYGPVVPSTTMSWLDDMSNRATGSPMDGAGQVFWAAKLDAGTANRVSVTKTVVGSTSWRRHRVAVAYDRWFGRAPSTSERDYWAKRLESGTTSAMDLALGAKPAARDAAGTSSAQRANHLAAALGLSSSYASSFRTKLDAGQSWASVLQAAYGSAGAKEARINAMGPRSSFTPSLAALGAELSRTGDERGPLVSVLATLPPVTLGY